MTLAFVSFVFLFNVVRCKSIQNKTIAEEMQERMDKLENFVQSLELTVLNINSSLQKAKERNPVMFYAIMHNKNFNLDKESTVVFEREIINEGEHYNKYDGVFVAPLDGLYLFSWTVSSYSNKWVMTELVIDGSIISSTGERTSATSDHTSASMTALYKMKKEEHAWIRTTRYSGPHYFYSNVNHPTSSFLGLLVHTL